MPIRRGKAFLTSRRFQQGRIVKRQKISQPFLESRDEQEDQEPEHTFRFTEDDALDDTEDFSVEQESCSRKRKTKSYDEIKAAEIQKWVNLRTQLLNSWTKNLLPDKRSCSACFSEVGDIFLCPDCDPTNNNPLCKDCLSIKHSTCSLHLPKHLQVCNNIIFMLSMQKMSFSYHKVLICTGLRVTLLITRFFIEIVSILEESSILWYLLEEIIFAMIRRNCICYLHVS